MLLVALACWLSFAPRAAATIIGPLLAQQALWAGPNAGNPNPQRTSSSPVGTLPGTFEVDDNGAARFSIPIELPPAVPDPHPLDGFTQSMLPTENSSQERRRLDTSNQVKERVVHAMQNPPAHAMISLELTMFFIGGDLSGVGQAIKGGRQVLMRQGGKEAWPLVAGVVKKKGRKGGPRAGQRFTPAGKRNVKEKNADAYGVTTCENCKRPTLPSQQSQRGITPSGAETNVDHIIPKVKGGNGAPDNGQVLCRDCNIRKGAK